MREKFINRLIKNFSKERTIAVFVINTWILVTAKSRLKKHITTKGDNWPVSNDKLTNIYSKQFLQFVKSINFDLL
jgi:hypothetical protein